MSQQTKTQQQLLSTLVPTGQFAGRASLQFNQGSAKAQKLKAPFAYGERVPAGISAAPQLSTPKYAGKRYGYQTAEANAGKFNDKTIAIMDTNVAAAMNAQLTADKRADAKYGLGDAAGDYTSVSTYGPDAFASIYLPDPSLITAGSAQVVNPGSSKAEQARNAGFGWGLVQILNPATNGRVQVGSDTHINTIGKVANDIYNQQSRVNQDAFDHFVGQLIYGLGPMLREEGIDVIASQPRVTTSKYGEQSATVYYDFTVNGISGPAKYGLLAETVPSMRTWLRDHPAEKKMLKDPMKVNTGKYGMTKYALYHPEMIQGGEAGITFTDGAPSFEYAAGYKSAEDRKNVLAYPTWTGDPANAEMIGDRVQPHSKANLFCDPRGSGAGVTEYVRGDIPEIHGIRSIVQKRARKSKSKKAFGDVQGEPLYQCGPAGPFNVDPRRNIYKAGGKRGGSMGLANFTDARVQAGNLPAKYGSAPLQAQYDAGRALRGQAWNEAKQNPNVVNQASALFTEYYATKQPALAFVNQRGQVLPAQGANPEGMQGSVAHKKSQANYALNQLFNRGQYPSGLQRPDFLQGKQATQQQIPQTQDIF